MAWVQSDLDAIDEAIASGAVEVEYADKRVKYRSLNDLRSVRKEIKDSLAGKNLSRRRYGVYYKNR